MYKNLINKIEHQDAKGLFYSTACLKVTEGNDFDTVYEGLLQFVKLTIENKHCIEYFAVPSNIEEREIMLWEVWESEETMQEHMNEEETKQLLEQNLVEFKWQNHVYMLNK